MSSPIGGTSLVEHLKQVEKTTKYTPPELTTYRSMQLPTQMVKYWYDFHELSERRDYSEHGPQALKFKDLESWARINDVHLSTLLQDTIFSLDRIWLNVQHENRKKQMRK